jgi:hypothetical protein
MNFNVFSLYFIFSMQEWKSHNVACYPGNATNNLWVLDLTLSLLDICQAELQLFTSQMYNFTIDCSGPLLSGVFFTVPHLIIWPFTFLFSNAAMAGVFVTAKIKILLYLLHRKQSAYVCVVVRTYLIVTQTMIQETWLPSRCLAMDSCFDSDIIWLLGSMPP